MLPKNHTAVPGMLRRRGGHRRATEEVSRLCHHMCVCVFFCSHTLLHLAVALSAPLYITGTRHRLHNASPPLRCRGAKQRHPASRNTATDADEEGPLFVYDRQVHRMVCDHVNAPTTETRQGVGFFSFFAGSDTGISKRRGSHSFPRSHCSSVSYLFLVNATQKTLILVVQHVAKSIFARVNSIFCTA